MEMANAVQGSSHRRRILWVEEQHIAAVRLQLAQAAAFATAAFLEGEVDTAAAVALHPRIARARLASPELEAFTRKVADEHLEWEGVGVIGADGNSIAGSAGGGPVYLGDRAYFQQAAQTGKPVVSLTVQSAVGEGSTFTLHFPFLSEAPPCSAKSGKIP